MSKFRHLINENIEAIRTGNTRGFQFIDLSSLGQEQEDKLLVLFAKICSDSESDPEIWDLALKPWIDQMKVDESKNIIGRLFTSKKLQLMPEVILNFVNLNRITLPKVALSIISYTDEDTSSTLGLIEYCYPEEDLEVYQTALSQITEGSQTQIFPQVGEDFDLNNVDELTSLKFPIVSNETLKEFLKEKIKKFSKFQRIPEYILKERIPLQGHNYKEDPSSLVVAIPKAEELSQLLIDDLTQHLTNTLSQQELDEMVMELRNTINESTATTFLYRISQPIYTKLFLDRDNDTELIRTFGPANTFVLENDLDIVLSSRMFTCRKFIDQNPDDDNSMESYHPSSFSWFKGNCDRCLKKIRAYHHAVRIPMEGGGWLGCFCCWNCVRKSIGRSKTKEEDLFLPKGIRRNLSWYFQDKIEKYGIYDRDYSDKNEVGRDLTFAEISGRKERRGLRKEAKKNAKMILSGADFPSDNVQQKEWSTTYVDVNKLISKGMMRRSRRVRSGKSKSKSKSVSISSMDSPISSSDDEVYASSSRASMK